MKEPTSSQKARWEAQASRKNAIVPHYFEVFPDHVILICGACRKYFKRTLIRNLNEPTFVCPQCHKRNWVPVQFDLHR